MLDAVTHEVSHVPTVLLDGVGTHLLIDEHQLLQFFRIEPGGQRCRPDEVTEHHRQVPTFAGARWPAAVHELPPVAGHVDDAARFAWG